MYIKSQTRKGESPYQSLTFFHRTSETLDEPPSLLQSHTTSGRMYEVY